MKLHALAISHRKRFVNFVNRGMCEASRRWAVVPGGIPTFGEGLISWAYIWSRIFQDFPLTKGHPKA